MDKIGDYIWDLYKSDEIIRKKEYEKDTELKYYCPVIDTSVAAFLKIFIKALKPQNILELGTSIGYSTTIMANAVKENGGRVTTVELDKRAAKAAMKNFKKYNIEKYVYLINDNVFNVLPTLEKGFDMIFLDLFNGLYIDVLDSCINLLKPGGVLLADDTLFPAIKNEEIFSESNKKLHAFNEKLSTHKDMDSFLLPIDDGITIAVKK